MKSVAELDAHIRELRAAGDHAGAAAAAAAGQGRFPDDWLTIGWWRIGALAAAGQPGAAITVLRAAVARGGWFPWDWLIDRDLSTLHGVQGFDEAVDECRRRQMDEVARSRPSLSLINPNGEPPWPVLIALHANGESASRALPHWSPAAAHGWLVAVPQSGTPVGPLRYAWAAATTGEIRRHAQSLRDAGMMGDRPVVLAGFSRGAFHALRLALGEQVPARAVVAVSPAFNDIDELLDQVPASAARGLRVAFHIGDKDAQASRAVPPVAKQLRDAGMDATVTVHPRLARDYPPGFDAILPAQLADLTT